MLEGVRHTSLARSTLGAYRNSDPVLPQATVAEGPHLPWPPLRKPSPGVQVWQDGPPLCLRPTSSLGTELRPRGTQPPCSCLNIRASGSRGSRTGLESPTANSCHFPQNRNSRPMQFSEGLEPGVQGLPGTLPARGCTQVTHCPPPSIPTCHRQLAFATPQWEGGKQG